MMRTLIYLIQYMQKISAPKQHNLNQANKCPLEITSLANKLSKIIFKKSDNRKKIILGCQEKTIKLMTLQLQ